MTFNNKEITFLEKLDDIVTLLEQIAENTKPKVTTITGVSGDPRPRPVGVMFNEARR